MPSSARLRKPSRFCIVPVNPTKSAPSFSRNIFLEKKEMKRDDKVEEYIDTRVQIAFLQTGF